MNSLERAMHTIRGEVPDRVPTDLHNFLPAVRLANYNTIDGLQQGELIAKSQIEAWERFKHDILLIENGTCAEAEALGCTVRYFKAGPPRVIEPAITSFKEIRSLSVPDPWETFPLNELLEATRIISEELGNKVFVMGRADQGPFALAAALVGYEKLIKEAALALRGKRANHLHEIQELLAFCVKMNRFYAKAQIEVGAHGTSFGEFGADLIGPNMYKDLIFPFDKELIEGLEKDGITVSLHICGDNTQIIDEMVQTGATILEVDQKPDKKVLKKATKDQATLLGPINPELIAHSNPKVIEERCKEAIDILAPGGRFILGPGCALGFNTPSENIDALINAAKDYGVYGN